MTEPGSMRPLTESEAELQADAIAEEYLDRLQAGGKPEKETLLLAHPEIAGILKPHLSLVEMLHKARDDPRCGGEFWGEGHVHHTPL